jgi:hypothetical protein
VSRADASSPIASCTIAVLIGLRACSGVRLVHAAKAD